MKNTKTARPLAAQSGLSDHPPRQSHPPGHCWRSRTLRLAAKATACCAALLLTFVAPAVPAKAAQITYGFDDGTLQGWIDRGGGTNHVISRTGGDMNGGQSQPNYAGIDNWAIRDSSASTLWLRSPAFVLNAVPDLTDLTFYLAGGAGSGTSALPANESAVPTGQGATGLGFLGLALRDAATGDFLLKACRAESGGNWLQFSFTVAQLEPLVSADPDRQYTLDFIDTRVSGWGWICLDEVTIPGTAAAVPTTSISGRVTDAASAGVAGVLITTYPGSLSGTTDLNGDYTITNAVVGETYTLAASNLPAGKQLNTAPAIFTALETPNTGKDFTLSDTTTISGKVTHASAGVQNVLVTAAPGNLTGVTNSDGDYVITGVTPGLSYSLRISNLPAGKVLDTAPAAFVALQAPNTGKDFTLMVGTLLTYNFDDGTLQGWTTVSSDPGNTPDPEAYISSNRYPGQGGSPRLVYFTSPNSDSPHKPLWIRSPEFKIDKGGNLSLWLLFGTGAGGWPGTQATLPTHASQIPLGVDSSPSGVMGVALRDTATGDFVRTGQKTFSEWTPAGWEQISWDVSDLRDNGKTYTLELFDYLSGKSYSSLGMDSVTIPGSVFDSGDVDADGIPDAYEIATVGDTSSLTATGDFDGDGTGDVAEYRLGLAPNNPASMFQATIVRNPVTGDVVLTWPSKMGTQFDVLWSEDLTPGSWFHLATVSDTTEEGATSTYVDPAAGLDDYPKSFYRIQLKP